MASQASVLSSASPPPSLMPGRQWRPRSIVHCNTTQYHCNYSKTVYHCNYSDYETPGTVREVSPPVYLEPPPPRMEEINVIADPDLMEDVVLDAGGYVVQLSHVVA